MDGGQSLQYILEGHRNVSCCIQKGQGPKLLLSAAQVVLDPFTKKHSDDEDVLVPMRASPISNPLLLRILQ
jgi:hypothetical protein